MDALRLSPPPLLLLLMLMLQVALVSSNRHEEHPGKRRGGFGDGILAAAGADAASHHLAFLSSASQHHPHQHREQQRQQRGTGFDVEESGAVSFLRTGDSSTLARANCSRRFELSSPPPLLLPPRAGGRRSGGGDGGGDDPAMASVLDTVMHAANFLNVILQANRSRERSVRGDAEWYHALVRSMLEGDDKIHRAVVTFHVDPTVPGPDVLLQATRTGGEIVLQDLSGDAHRHLRNRSAETEWYHGVKDRKRKQPAFRKRVLSQDFTSADNSLKRGESYIPDKTHVKWSPPYLECENGNLVPRWLLTLSAGFYGLKKSEPGPQFRGVVRVDINLQDVDIDQCSSDGWFAGTHRCNLTTMECLPMRGYGFVLDKYQCQCKKGFYHPNRVAVNSFARVSKSGRVTESGPNADESWSSDCLPCAPGCAFCKDDTLCVAREDGALRLVVISFQCLCMLVLFISMVVIYHFRRNKSIRASVS
ncbi:metabotropic glycine receptor-like [Eucyclogobius newberryi]|uniref:metabotropic glycine receptor-like n=1 Tax=Eucyclogobius newberryi TaxID=166745 RepID=UPI003B5C311B